MKNKRVTPLRVLGSLVGLLVLIQLIPYGRAQSNPPLTGEPPWDSQATRDLFFRACADCHSNETHWPWYSQVAPSSWLLQNDVDEAREHFNVSEWGRPGKNKGDEAGEELRDGDMPLWFYPPLHPEARLSAEQKKALIAGLSATFGEKHED